MAKYGPTSVTITVDDAAGTPRIITDQVLSINDVSISAIMTDSHGLGKAWFEALAVGINKLEPLVLRAFLDDTALTGFKTVFGAVASGPASATRTVVIVYGGSNSTTFEAHVEKISKTPARENLTMMEVTLRPTGTVTDA